MTKIPKENNLVFEVKKKISIIGGESLPFNIKVTDMKLHLKSSEIVFNQAKIDSNFLEILAKKKLEIFDSVFGEAKNSLGFCLGDANRKNLNKLIKGCYSSGEYIKGDECDTIFDTIFYSVNPNI